MASSIALLVIDVQEDYLNQETLQPNRSESVASIESAVSAAREAGFAVAHVRTLVSAEGEAVMPHRAASRRCVIGTPGAESPIQALSTEPIFGKAFFSSFSGGQLEAWLRAQGAKQLILVGGYTHACIRETALEAYERGYSVSIVSDAIFSDRPSFALETLDWISTRAAQLVTVSDLAKLQNSTPGNLDLSPTATAQLSWAAKP
ncbi:MAG: cysteine hydrolase family protein, partial [Micrococcales bacterium]